MTNSGFFQLFDRHEREDYNATLSEAAIRQMISEEFEEADKIISAGFDKETLKTLDANGQPFIPTRKSDKFHMRKHTASSHIITVTRSMNLSMSCPASVPSTSEIPSEN